MATAIFDGLDGDWAGAGNWSGGSGASGVPGAGDDIYVRTAVADVDTNLNSFAAIAIVTMTVAQNIKKRLGSSSAAIELTSITTLNYAGGGEWCKITTSGTTATTNAFPTGGTLYLVSGTFTTVNARGRVEIGTAAVVTNGYLISGEWRDASNGTGYTLLYVGSGAAYLKRSGATVIVNRGTVEAQDAVAVSTKLTINNGGVYTHKSTGTIALYEVFPGGTFSVAGNPYSGFTLSAHTIWEGSRVIDSVPGVTVTKSANATYRGLLNVG